MQPRPSAGPNAAGRGASSPSTEVGGGVDNEALEALYKEMDTKDDEINKQSQTITKLEEDIATLRETHSKLAREHDKGSEQMEKYKVYHQYTQCSVCQQLANCKPYGL